MPDTPADLIERPEATPRMDALTSVLQSVRLTGGVFLEARVTAPWCVSAGVTAEDCRPFLEGPPAQVIAYHYVAEGRLLMSVEGEPPLEVGAGEIVLLPRNDPHLLASGPNLQPIDAESLIQPGEGGLARIDYGGGGAPTRLVCGFLGSAQAQNPLIADLPRALKLNVRDGASREWIEASLRLAAQELASGRAAAPGLVARLAELLFVEAVRSYADSLPSEQTGWLKGLRDPYVGRALALIHGDPRRPWTTAALAREVALSRSAFAERFAAALGMPPIRYLTHWRMQLARQELAAGRKSVAQIAFEAGYESEAAFNRAFKREFGAPPARWRIAQAALRTAPDPSAAA